MTIIETERLILRDYRAEDLSFLAKMDSDEKVMEFYPRTYSLQESADFIKKQSEQIKNEGFGFFAVEEKESGRFIGFAGLNRVDFEVDFTPAVEIGWRLVSDFWRKGLATEAARACLEYGRGLRLGEIVAFTAKINERSQRVMEKIGMRYEREFMNPRVAAESVLARHVLYSYKL